jgi:hypothetical protein
VGLETQRAMNNCFTFCSIDTNIRIEKPSLKKVNGDQHARNIEPKKITQTGTYKQ